MKTNLQEFINALYHNRKVIELLFANKPHTKFKDELFDYDKDFTEERFNRLKQFQIIQESENKYFLDERVIEFLNDFLEIGDINIGEIGIIIQKIRRNLVLYQETESIKYAQEIKRFLQNLKNILKVLAIKLRKKVDNSYKSAQSYELKKLELGFCRQDINSLEDSTEEIKKLLDEYKSFFGTDAEISQLITNLKRVFVENSDYLFSIQNQIVEYLHKIYEQDLFYKHIQQLKELKDTSAGLQNVSNISKVAEQYHNLFLNKYEKPKTNVALNYLFDDDGIKILKRIREKRNEIISYTPKEKKVNNTTTAEETIVEIDKDELFALFQRNTENLFEYLIKFDFSQQDFSQNINSQNLKLDDIMRVNLFVEMVVDYGDFMLFTDNYATFDLKNHPTMQALDYQIILPKVA